MRMSKLILGALVLLPLACGPSADPLFVQRTKSGVTFNNALGYHYEFNIYRYRNFYNGGGVALGDVDGDGLLDLFLTANQGKNRLYLNRGDWVFDDVTERAGVAGSRSWSTGVSMADINGDGWLDIYVCNSGIVQGDDKRNELYINRGDGTFDEQAAAYSLDDAGLSIHGSFLDYDRDGDLDLYLVNNSFRNIQEFNLEKNTRHLRHAAGGDRLYRNDGSAFTDVSAAAGIYGSEIGFGLGVSVGDVNRDGWPDLYVSNDFFERDYLYLNRGDGTFEEALERSIKSVSAAAMGADMADLNGDSYPDIFVTDMLPSDARRSKTVTSFDSWSRYQDYIRNDYYHQFTRNTLHMNLGGGPRNTVHFAEVGRFARVEASDWSWGALIADFDHDGHRDVFVANGVYQDLTNADFLVEVSKKETIETLVDRDSVDWPALIAMMPSNPVPNHAFAGNGAMRFRDVAADWGLDAPGFSNGSAYGDLDNDGDLDLVINNVNQQVSLYENRATRLYPRRTWLQIALRGAPPNTFGVGAQITAWHQDRVWHADQQPVRGYQSSVDPVVHLGLGPGVAVLDSLIVDWPSGRATRLSAVTTGRRLVVEEDAPQVKSTTPAHAERWMTPVDPQAMGLDWQHQENVHNDFAQQPLLFHMRSTEGPAVCTGDADGDGNADLYLGGARGQPGTVWQQHRPGLFSALAQPFLVQDSTAEDTDCVWLDVDADGDQDLYVASGSSELPASSSALVDRLYVNDGAGLLHHHGDFQPPGRSGFEPTGAVAAADADGDRDLDLFVGARLKPFAYGVPVDGHLLLNDGTGAFTEATDTHAPALRGLGMITGAVWGDLDGDGDADLAVVGEWMPVTVLYNDAGTLSRRTSGLEATHGWWQSVHMADLDHDGDLDLVAGNHGLNSRFRAAPGAPLEIWTSDFDRNGRVEQILAMSTEGIAYPMALRHDLVAQIPSLVALYPTYASFAGASVQDIFTAQQLEVAAHLQVFELRSLVLINDGRGVFEPVPLPMAAQLSPIYASLSLDISGDGLPEVLMGGNLYEAKPEVGRYDASYGTVLDKTGQAMSWMQSGFWVDGAVRAIFPLRAGDKDLVVVALNNDSLRVFSYEH